MVQLDLWLYGPLARFGGEGNRGSHAHLQMEMPAGTRMSDLLQKLSIPDEEKGITFINAQLTDMPGLRADRELELRHGDRIGIFHPKSMWPFQYRHGASITPQLKDAMEQLEGGALHHSSGGSRDEAS
jgi:hypothetical protein